MVEAAEILKAVHDIFDNGEVTLSVDERSLGMAYAVPRGLESSATGDFGPWHDAEVRQVFFRQSVLGAPVADVEFHPLLGSESALYRGVIRANGTSEFNQI